MKYQRLYINIDHIATLRQSRGGAMPDPLEGAAVCRRAGADGITAHLREDRRHIQDEDVAQLATIDRANFNLEMACTDEMLCIAERLRPKQVTLVPERRQELTTEGGLDVVGERRRVADGVARMNAAGIRTSLFIGPDRAQIDASRAAGAAAIELHTGPFAHHPADPATVTALRDAARYGASIGLAIHAGHGLTVANVRPVAAIPEIEELNIGHSVVSRAIFIGLADAVRELRAEMDAARARS